jgi:hypothetical protein
VLVGASDPPELPPGTDLSIYSGEAGWKVVPGTTRLVARRVAAGEVLAQQGVAYRRTGVLREPIVNMAADDHAKGTPVYAVPLSDGSTAWCVPRVLDTEGRIISTERMPENCYYLDREDGVPYRTKAFMSNSAFHSTRTLGSAFIKTPVLVDETIKRFDHPMTLSLRLRRAQAGQLRYDVVFTDSFGATWIFTDTALPGAEGSWVIPIWGGILTVRRDGKFYAVTETAPLRDKLGEHSRLRGTRNEPEGITSEDWPTWNFPWH